jgi:hypothetical protein
MKNQIRTSQLNYNHLLLFLLLFLFFVSSLFLHFLLYLLFLNFVWNSICIMWWTSNPSDILRCFISSLQFRHHFLCLTDIGFIIYLFYIFVRINRRVWFYIWELFLFLKTSHIFFRSIDFYLWLSCNFFSLRRAAPCILENLCTFRLI